jgi:hypothetical protein
MRHSDREVESRYSRIKDTLSSPDKTYSLVQTVLSFYATQLKKHTDSHFRIGIIGNPNRGKTTFAYNLHLLLQQLDIGTQYHDLDLYTRSGLAISGQLSWEDRPKVKSLDEAAITQSIAAFQSSSQQFAIADFPGMAESVGQGQRLHAVDLAVLLTTAQHGDQAAWLELADETQTKALVFAPLQSDHYAFVEGSQTFLPREMSNSLHLETMIAAAHIIDQSAQAKGITLPGAWPYIGNDMKSLYKELTTLCFLD